MKVWEVDNGYVRPRPDSGSFDRSHEDQSQTIDFEKIIDQAWPEGIMHWDRPFCRIITMTDRHVHAKTWQCGSKCPEDHQIWCRRDRHHRNKCSDIMARTDRVKITKSINKIRMEEMESIIGRGCNTTVRRYNIKQLKKILREEP